MVVLSILCEWVKVAASRQALVAIVLVAKSVRYTFAAKYLQPRIPSILGRVTKSWRAIWKGRLRMGFGSSYNVSFRSENESLSWKDFPTPDSRPWETDWYCTMATPG